MYAVMGKVLHVDLTQAKCKTIEIPEEVYRKYLSGMGLGAWYLTKHIPKGADPLGPENILGFTSGVLTGTGALMSGRFIAMAKSPLTGGWGDANCGGFFAPAIKQCGFDAIFFSGASKTPVYLYVDQKGPQLLDASEYWGRDATEAELQLIEKHWVKKKPQVAVIGEAGEKCSLLAGICTDCGRIAARSGIGAVMGSKKLKAVVLAGIKQPTCADPEKMKGMSKKLGTTLKKVQPMPLLPGGIFALVGKLRANPKELAPSDGMGNTMYLKQFGTAVGVPTYSNSGEAPIKNWGGSSVDVQGRIIKSFNPKIINKSEYQKYHCFGCGIGCGGKCRIIQQTGGVFEETHKPEYETLQAFGGLLLNENSDQMFYINEVLNRAGMDSISCGTTIAFALECFEKGIITEKDTDGLQLRWGDSQVVVALVKKMIHREGFGEVLADGTKKAAERIGRGSEVYAMNIGGQEPGLHDPRLNPQLGVHFVLDATPGRHTRGSATMYAAEHIWEICSWAPVLEKHDYAREFTANDTTARMCMANSCYTMLIDALGLCMYGQVLGVPYLDGASLADTALGWGEDGNYYMEIGKRIQTTRQYFNAREGVPAISRKLPDRLAGSPPQGEGANKGKSLANEETLKLCYQHFGWDVSGIPTRETMDTLGIHELLEVEL